MARCGQGEERSDPVFLPEENVRPRLQLFGDAAADRGSRFPRIRGEISGQKTRIPFRDEDGNIGERLFEGVKGACVIGMGMGQNDPDDRFSDRAGLPQNQNPLGAAGKRRVNQCQTVLFLHQVTVDGKDAGQELHG